MITIILATAGTAVLAAAAAAAQAPVASGKGLVVAQGGRIYVEGAPVAKGSQPAWSPDGTQLAYVRFGEVYVSDAAGHKEKRLTRRAPGLHWPANGPTGRRTGRRSRSAAHGDVLTVPATGGGILNLTKAQESWRGNVTPAYSPDGKSIAFSRNTDAFNSDIFLMSAGGKNLRRLTRTQGGHDVPGEEHGPTWSPDGRTLVFVSNRDGNFELYSIGRDGKNERRLTGTPRSAEETPRFSSDGPRLLYVHHGRVAMIKRDGTGARELGVGAAADW